MRTARDGAKTVRPKLGWREGGAQQGLQKRRRQQEAQSQLKGGERSRQWLSRYQSVKAIGDKSVYSPYLEATAAKAEPQGLGDAEGFPADGAAFQRHVGALEWLKRRVGGLGSGRIEEANARRQRDDGATMKGTTAESTTATE